MPPWFCSWDCWDIRLWRHWWRVNKLRRLRGLCHFPHPGVWTFLICVLHDSVKYCHYARIATSKHGVSGATLVTDDQWDLGVENMAEHHSWPTGYLRPLCSCSFGDFQFSFQSPSTWWTKHALSLSLRQTDTVFKGAQQSCTLSLKFCSSKTHLC